MPILRSCSPNDVPDYKVCRLFGSTDPIPFGTSGDNDYILASYWYADGKGDSVVVQTAYNIRANETATRRYHPTYGWQPWVISNLTGNKYIVEVTNYSLVNITAQSLIVKGDRVLLTLTGTCLRAPQVITL